MSLYGYKLLISTLIQRTIDHMLKGKSCLDFNEFNSFHNKTSTDQETPGQLVRPQCQSLLVQRDEHMSYNEKFNDYSFSDRAFPIQLSC